jgi:hypothetical protein
MFIRHEHTELAVSRSMLACIRIGCLHLFGHLNPVALSDFQLEAVLYHARALDHSNDNEIIVISKHLTSRCIPRSPSPAK